MEIKVLGPGCPNCERLEQDLMSLMTELQVKADLEHVRNPLEISEYGVMGMPGLVVNGQIKCTGKVPSREQLKTWLLEAVGKLSPADR
ncbi:MAG: thioredoxin family protein [Deltaproteobacteria bacterium]|nr:thioredoxin family protein [Deltaproteobacteria bacterium]